MIFMLSRGPYQKFHDWHPEIILLWEVMPTSGWQLLKLLNWIALWLFPQSMQYQTEFVFGSFWCIKLQLFFLGPLVFIIELNSWPSLNRLVSFSVMFQSWSWNSNKSLLFGGVVSDFAWILSRRAEFHRSFLHSYMLRGNLSLIHTVNASEPSFPISGVELDAPK